MAGNTKNRYGQANPGPVGPTRTRVVTQQKATASQDQRRLTAIESGSGPVVTGVSVDRSRDQLVVSRGGAQTSLAVASTRFGQVMHECAHIANATAIPTVDHWIEFDANGDPLPAQTILLPSTFQHSDGFSPSDPWVSLLPSGMAWVRLGVGSEPLGEARWDADVVDQYVEPSDNSDAPKKPTLLRAYHSDDEVTLVFNVPVTPPDRLYTIQRDRLVVHSSKSARINVTAAVQGTADNIIVLTLDKTPTPDEILTVQLDAGAVRSKSVPSWATAGSFNGTACRPSPPIPAVALSPRACYVLAMNRMFDGDTLAVDSKVFLSACMIIRDSEGIEWPVYDILPMAEGGGGDVATMAFLPATVVKRELGAPGDHFYTVSELPAGHNPLAPITWGWFALPITFKHGDSLPTTGLPAQIGWVRMRYPAESKLGTNGKAGEVKEYGSVVYPTVGTSLVRAELRGGTELTLWFNERTSKRPGSPPFTQVDLNNRMTITHSVVGGPTITVVSVVDGDQPNKYVVTISGATAAQWQEISDSGGFKVNLLEVLASPDPTLFFSETSGSVFIENNIQSNFSGVFNDDRTAYLLVMNRVTDSTLPIGTSLNVSLRSYEDIPDTATPPNLRRVYDVTPGTPPTGLNLYEIIAGNVVGYWPNNNGIKWTDVDIFEEVAAGFKLPASPWSSGGVPITPEDVVANETVLTDSYGVVRRIGSNTLHFAIHAPGVVDADKSFGDVLYCPMSVNIPIDITGNPTVNVLVHRSLFTGA